ncbi:MAG: class I SAM-dependent methyltransferase [Candidatus Omnitrophota bacterium]
MEYERGGSQKEHYSVEETTIRNCPLCDSNDYLEIYKERGPLGIVKCNNCSFIYVNPMVKDPGKNYWGDEEKYFKEAKLVFEGTGRHHRDPNYLEDLKIIESIKPEGNFLDIGTNIGFFLRNTRGKDWNVFGVEPSPALSDMARKYFNLNIKTCYLSEAGFEEDYFDIVTMTDVFEHIVEPKKILEDIGKVLKKNGILFIKVPNGKYNLLKLWLAKVTRKLKDHDIFDSYEHVSHFTQETLQKMLNECGYRIKRVFIGKPIQIPVWHKYVGHYYQYPSPAILDLKNYALRQLFYWISKVESLFIHGNIGYFAPNIIVVAEKK